MNDMRDRLIELISDMENELLRAYQYTTDEYRIASIADHLIENGAILPPCKVGDTLYDISEFVNGCSSPEIYESAQSAVIHLITLIA